MAKRTKDVKKRKFYLKFVLIVFFIILITYLAMLLGLILFEKFQYIIVDTPFRMSPFALFLLFMLGALLIGLLITSFMATGFLRPINKLSDATKRVAGGDFSVEIEHPEKESEMGELIANFNMMVRDLRSIETLKTDFIANVSHEFKTPLSTIQGYSTLLQDENLSEEERASYTKYIIEATKQLSSLIGNILKLSKLENHESEVERERIDVAEQIRQAILFMETQWSIKNIDLDIDLCTGEVFANADLLMQVWLNVIGNAIKFSDYAGKLIVKSEVASGMYKVTVKDYGCGMDDDTLKRVFEKFYQGDNSHSKEGNGLGMALVKKIIDLHKGEILVESELNKGTVFYISFPIA